jgi:hypothetical protein
VVNEVLFGPAFQLSTFTLLCGTQEIRSCANPKVADFAADLHHQGAKSQRGDGKENAEGEKSESGNRGFTLTLPLSLSPGPLFAGLA